MKRYEEVSSQDFSRSTTAALYCFSSSQAAKYLGQYIDSHLRFVNQIPESILGMSTGQGLRF